jgi:hypothetical protein
MKLKNLQCVADFAPVSDKISFRLLRSNFRLQSFCKILRKLVIT